MKKKDMCLKIKTIMKLKDERIFIRLTTETKEKFKIVAQNRGLTISSLLHSLVVKSIREEEKEYPTLFGNKPLGKPFAEIEIFEENSDTISKTG